MEAVRCNGRRRPSLAGNRNDIRRQYNRERCRVQLQYPLSTRLNAAQRARHLLDVHVRRGNVRASSSAIAETAHLTSLYRKMQNVFQYVEPFRHGSRV